MRIKKPSTTFFLILLFLKSAGVFSQGSDHVFDFNQNVNSGHYKLQGSQIKYSSGIEGLAVDFDSSVGYSNLRLDGITLDNRRDFSIQCWIKTRSSLPTVILSQKSFMNKGIIAQKNPGWALYSSGGTLGWSVGSGDRRINYERDNGEKIPLNDGQWHLITMTFSENQSEFRLYYDGQNKAIYKVNFDFTNSEPIMVGSSEDTLNDNNSYSPAIENGKYQVQKLVDEFNKLIQDSLENNELVDLIVDPVQVLGRKDYEISQDIRKDRLTKVLEVRKEMLANPYTVFQNRALTELKPVSRLYALQEGEVIIKDSLAKVLTQNEKLYPSDFEMDELTISDYTLNPEEVLSSYLKYKKSTGEKLTSNLQKVKIGVWNIWHGGIHWTEAKDGWDSRLRIVEMLREKNIDVILMQETYSSGDFIAAELGYHYVTTSDWDYRYQGSNISVMSKFPITEVEVLEETEFNNVAVKLAISETQEIWAMSNWYGMQNFDKVFEFHQQRFTNSDNIPVLFGGDFNAIPHLDGGDSHASKMLLEAGFTDAFRSIHPNVNENPGFSHRNGERIDQLYFKGKTLKNTSTETISSWPSGFPSDHYLIIAEFDLVDR